MLVLDPERHGLPKAEKTADKAEKKGRGKARRATEDGQREFGFFSVVGEHNNAAVVRERATGEAHQPAAELPLPAVKPIPATRETVDFSDLSWIPSVKHPLTHEPTVYAVGMLMMSGLHYRVAARLVGKTAASFRTLRTRMGVPIDRDRNKMVQTFDLDVAKATAERGEWIVARSLWGDKQRDGAPRLFFWKRMRDRNTHMSPVLRARDPMFSRQPPEMTIITRQKLEAEERSGLVGKGTMQSLARAAVPMAELV